MWCSLLTTASTCINSSNPFSLTGMASQHLQNQIANMRDELFKQGYLDEQFVQLEELQDDADPNFTEEFVKMFFTESLETIHKIEKALEKTPLDFEKLDKCMHQLKGGSSSIGAAKVKHESLQFRENCKGGDAEGCKRSFELLKKEYVELRKKLEDYFQMARGAEPSETATQPK